MTAYKWTEKGLVPELSDKLEQDTSKSDDKSSKGEKNPAYSKSRESPKSKMVAKNPWKRIASLKSAHNTKINKLLAHLTFRFDRNTFDFKRNGTITVHGREVPGSDIVKILHSVVAKSSLELGEMLILHILAHSPKNIARLIRKSKKELIRDEEEDPTEFRPVLNAHKLPGSKRVSLHKKGTERFAGKKGKKEKSNVSTKSEGPKHNPTERVRALTGKATIAGDSLARELRKLRPKKRAWYHLSEKPDLKPRETII